MSTSDDICFEWLTKDICNINEFITKLNNIPKLIDGCNKWELKYALLLNFLNSLLSNKTPPPLIQQKLTNIIQLFGKQFTALQQILSSASAARSSILDWKISLMETWSKAASSGPNQLAYVKGEKNSIVLVGGGEEGKEEKSANTVIPDFDILLIVGGPLNECNDRLDIMMDYLSVVGKSKKAKKRHIIISGRGGWSLSNANAGNWVHNGGTKEEAKTEAEYILKNFLSRFTADNVTQDLIDLCKISVDTAALDTVGNAVMAKYLSLQANVIEGNAEKTFAGKTIVSVSNLYHIGRLVYLMKNFMPKATHYGVIKGGAPEEMKKVNKNPDSSDSIKQAYDQSFTRDVGYIVPTFSNNCVRDGEDKPLDLGLFEFLMHHGLYHRSQIVDQLKDIYDRRKKIWNSEMTSKEVIQYMGNFCLPFTSLTSDWNIESVINTKIFKENCNMAKSVMDDRYDTLYTFSNIECTEELSLPPLPTHPSPVAPSHWKDKITNPMRHHLGYGGNKQKRRKKRTRRRKKKKKKNRSRKK
jgi:hypothetical protein